MRACNRSLKFAAMVLAALASPALLRAQDAAADRSAALAVADSALDFITRGQLSALADLMIPEAVLFPTVTRDGVTRYRTRTAAQQRSASMDAVVTERGWNPDVRISGGMATVWYPYDLYRDNQWSHCGVDVFVLVRHEKGWRILTMAWSAEQPPVCEKHPKGPPPPR